MSIHSLEQLFEAYRDRFMPDRAEGVSGAVQLKLSGAEAGEWFMEVSQGRLHIEEGVHHDPTATVACRSEDWIAVSTGRAHPMSLVFSGRMRVSGSLATATQFQQLFRTDD